MVEKVYFYHAGCEVCADTERQFVENLDKSKLNVERVNLAEKPARRAEAKSAGVKTVPAFVIAGKPYHINFGANLAELK